ncbi:MAG: NUDIX domain-containing protein [Rhizobiaceae bacterium]
MNQTAKNSLRLAVSVVIREGDKFLLVERANEPGKGSFAFPGGKVEPGEALDIAIKRELLEETNLELLDATLYDVLPVSGASGDYLLHVYLARAIAGVPKAGDDAASFGWYSQEEMRGLTMPQSVRDMVAKLLLA